MVDQANKFKSEEKQGINDYSLIIYREMQLLIPDLFIICLIQEYLLLN